MKAKPVNQAKQKMDAEEEALLAAYEDGSLTIGPATSQEKAEARRAATATLKRDKRMNVRMSSMERIELQTKAAKLGMPYQTLVASVLHQYLTGRLVGVDK